MLAARSEIAPCCIVREIQTVSHFIAVISANLENLFFSDKHHVCFIIVCNMRMYCTCMLLGSQRVF